MGGCCPSPLRLVGARGTGGQGSPCNALTGNTSRALALGKDQGNTAEGGFHNTAVAWLCCLPCRSRERCESFLAPFPKFRRRGKCWLSCSSGSPRASPIGFPCRRNGWRRVGLKVSGAEKTACEPSVRYKSKVVTFQCSNF